MNIDTILKRITFLKKNTYLYSNFFFQFPDNTTLKIIKK